MSTKVVLVPGYRVEENVISETFYATVNYDDISGIPHDNVREAVIEAKKHVKKLHQEMAAYW